ncbi:hypothetical protein ABZX85_14635 [Streptomyces sp. NPDC004539]
MTETAETTDDTVETEPQQPVLLKPLGSEDAPTCEDGVCHL